MNSDTPPAPGAHMSPAEFRAAGYAAIDWIADYLEKIETRPVLSTIKPGAVAAALPAHPPAQGEPFSAMLADLERIVMPGITHWQHPSFFAFFNSNASGPSILAELLSAGIGVQGMLWATSPACTEVETVMMDWLAELLGLPEVFRSTGPGGGVIQDTASSATLCAILTARERATNWRSDRAGVEGKLCVYASDQTHSSIEKAVRIAGLGKDQLRLVPSDARGALDPAALKAAIAADRAAGHTPCAVVATVGTTSSHAIDPVRALGAICNAEGIWLHVDAAHAGTAAVCPEHRWIHDGVELADSYCMNPHKWMFTNFDCDAYYVRDRAALVRTLSVLPEYLRNAATESGKVIDYRDWHIPLGRRFRALKLWFVMRHYGVLGLRKHIGTHIAVAQQFAANVQATDDFELATPAPLNLVCFRHRGGDAVNQRILDRVNGSGAAYLTHTRIDDRLTLRLCIGGTYTEARHVEAAWQAIQRAARG
ncbi:MAG: aminotransferase class V-fold PLP-dependent enzyme [Myxococcales bacterium]|nr:aminotransferase class V-fold PLP-dependent enzyme [Myxococcales bacterium]